MWKLNLSVEKLSFLACGSDTCWTRSRIVYIKSCLEYWASQYPWFCVDMDGKIPVCRRVVSSEIFELTFGCYLSFPSNPKLLHFLLLNYSNYNTVFLLMSPFYDHSIWYNCAVELSVLNAGVHWAVWSGSSWEFQPCVSEGEIFSIHCDELFHVTLFDLLGSFFSCQECVGSL